MKFKNLVVLFVLLLSSLTQASTLKPSNQKYNTVLGPLEGWDVVVTYHWADVQIGGEISWKQAQHHEAMLSPDYYASRTLAQNYAKNGFWLSPSSGGNPTPPQHYLPAAAIHDVALVYVFVNVK